MAACELNNTTAYKQMGIGPSLFDVLVWWTEATDNEISREEWFLGKGKPGKMGNVVEQSNVAHFV